MKPWHRLLAFTPLIPALIGLALACRPLSSEVRIDKTPKGRQHSIPASKPPAAREKGLVELVKPL